MVRSGRDVWVWIGLLGSMVLYVIGNMVFGMYDWLIGFFCLLFILLLVCNFIMVNDVVLNCCLLGVINGWF